MLEQDNSLLTHGGSACDGNQARYSGYRAICLRLLRYPGLHQTAAEKRKTTPKRKIPQHGSYPKARWKESNDGRVVRRVVVRILQNNGCTIIPGHQSIAAYAAKYTAPLEPLKP